MLRVSNFLKLAGFLLVLLSLTVFAHAEQIRDYEFSYNLVDSFSGTNFLNSGWPRYNEVCGNIYLDNLGEKTVYYDPNSEELSAPGCTPFSISAWVKIGYDNGQASDIITMYRNYRITARQSPNSNYAKIHFGVHAKNGVWKETAAYKVPYNTWIHVTGVYYPEIETIILYVNGYAVRERIVKKELSDPPLKNLALFAEQGLGAGEVHPKSDNFYQFCKIYNLPLKQCKFDGAMDKLKFFDESLSSEEVYDIYADEYYDFYCPDIPPFDRCTTNEGPVIERQIPDRTISYLDSTYIDLWDYIDDYDDSFTELNWEVEYDGDSVACIFDDERYLLCNSTIELGTTTIFISVTDPCGESAETDFDITVTNSRPNLSVPNQTKSCEADLDKFIDLRTYSWDEDIDGLYYDISGFTNTDFLECEIVDDYYLSCEVIDCVEDYTDISITVFDVFGEYYEDTFRFNINDFAPIWKQLPSGLCINSPTQKIIDLSKYVYDLEDGNIQDFNIVSQSNTSFLNCQITDTTFLSCNYVGNAHGSSNIVIRATDSIGQQVDATLTLTANCFNTVIFEATEHSVCMENFTTHSIELSIKNNSGEKKCYDFDLDADRDLQASLTQENICVNDKETRKFTLSLVPLREAKGDYVVKVYSIDDDYLYDGNLSMDFDISVGNCKSFDGFRINEFDGKICQGKKEIIDVEVVNSTTSDKTIALNADNSFLLPYFAKKNVFVPANSSVDTELVINADGLALGYHNVYLRGTALGYVIEKHLEVEVVDCSSVDKRTFYLEVPPTCFDVRRGGSINSIFTVKRTNDGCGNYYRDERLINFAIYGMPSALSYNSALLDCGEEKAVNFTINVPADARAGAHLISIVGTESDYTETKDICINVLGENSARVLLKDAYKEIIQCDTAIFELEVINDGDLEQTFTVSTLAIPGGINISINPTSFVLKKGESKIVYISVSTNASTPIKNGYSVGIVVQGNGQTYNSTLTFDVIEGTLGKESIEFLSYSQEISAKGNTNVKYYLMLRNNTSTPMDLHIFLDNLPNDINGEELWINNVLPGEVRELSGTIWIGDTNGDYSLGIVATNGINTNKKELTLHVEANPLDQGFVFGLFGFSIAFNDFMQAGVLAIFLILLLYLVIIGFASVSKSSSFEQSEPWMEDY